MNYHDSDGNNIRLIKNNDKDMSLLYSEGYKFLLRCNSPYMLIGKYKTETQAKKALKNYIIKDVRKVERTLYRITEQAYKIKAIYKDDDSELLNINFFDCPETQ